MLAKYVVLFFALAAFVNAAPVVDYRPVEVRSPIPGKNQPVSVKKRPMPVKDHSKSDNDDDGGKEVEKPPTSVQPPPGTSSKRETSLDPDVILHSLNLLKRDPTDTSSYQISDVTPDEIPEFGPGPTKLQPLSVRSKNTSVKKPPKSDKGNDSSVKKPQGVSPKRETSLDPDDVLYLVNLLKRTFVDADLDADGEVSIALPPPSTRSYQISDVIFDEIPQGQGEVGSDTSTGDDGVPGSKQGLVARGFSLSSISKRLLGV